MGATVRVWTAVWLLASVAIGFHVRRSYTPRLARGRLAAASQEDQDMADQKEQRKVQEKAKFEARKNELEALRERIKAMADDQELEVETPWTPEMTSAEKGPDVPEVSKLAKVLGDDRGGGDSEYDISDEELEA